MSSRSVRKKNRPVVACVDLFCGAGGLSHGLRKAGLKIAAGVDIDPACKYPFEANNSARFVNQDVRELSPRDLDALFGKCDVKVLAGCAPCQPFSTYSQRYESDGVSGKWGLLYEFSRLVEEVMPDIVTMENVPTVRKHSVFLDFINLLDKLKYNVTCAVVRCVEYGVPQNRRRMVVLASRRGTKIELVPASHKHPVSVERAIGSLPPLLAGEVDPNDSLHVASSLSKLNLARIRASRPGGTWRDWPVEMVADCHQGEAGKTYPSVYGRMEWKKPAPTMTTQCYGFGNGRFGHPEQDRAISLREAAILQSFPKGYKFVRREEQVNMRTLGRLIGNAVPVKLGSAIGKSIMKHLELD